MKLGYPGATFLSLPPNLQDADTQALGYAIDRQMEKLMKFFRKLQFWTNLDELDPKYYDYAAASIRALYYSSEYDDATKLSVLKEALQVNKYAGTVRGIEKLIRSLFGDAEFVPWYKYDGKPYHFKIIVPSDPSEESLEKFKKILSRVKAARSVIDYIETKTYVINVETYLAYGVHNFEKMEEQK